MDVTKRRRWDQLLFWGFLGSMALVRAGHMEERDPYWQIRAGAENLAGLPLARPDTWSWSGVEGDWYPNSPLWNMLLAAAYQLAGFWGFFLLSSATILLLVLLIDVLGRRLGARRLPGLVGLLVVFAAAFPMLSARATLAVQVLLLFAVYLALRAGERVTELGTGALAGILLVAATALSTLGNWIHLSFLLLAPVMAVVWAIVWLLTPGLGTGRRWALILSGGAGWLLGPLLSPYGISSGLARARAVQEACEGLLLEWRSPLSPGVPLQFPIMLVISLVLAGGSGWWLLRRWRSGHPSRTLAALVTIGCPLALAGLTAIRFVGVALLVLAPVAAAAATRAADLIRLRLQSWPSRSGLRARLQDYSSGRTWRIVLTATLVVVSPGVVLLGGQHGVPAEQALVAELPSQCHLFSESGVGSAVVLLRPDVPVWMDGRADFFGREIIELGYAFYRGEAPDPVPAGTTCVIVDRNGELTPGLRERLATSGSWRLASSRDGYELWLPGPS